MVFLQPDVFTATCCGLTYQPINFHFAEK